MVAATFDTCTMAPTKPTATAGGSTSGKARRRPLAFNTARISTAQERRKPKVNKESKIDVHGAQKLRGAIQNIMEATVAFEEFQDVVQQYASHLGLRQVKRLQRGVQILFDIVNHKVLPILQTLPRVEPDEVAASVVVETDEVAASVVVETRGSNRESPIDLEATSPETPQD